MLLLTQTNPLPTDFFTFQSMLTLTGATGVVYVVSNGIQHAFDYNPKWLALALALITSLAGTLSSSPISVGNIFIGIVNGFLIYCTAVGATQVTGKKQGEATAKGIGNAAEKSNKRTFTTSWF